MQESASPPPTTIKHHNLHTPTKQPVSQIKQPPHLQRDDHSLSLSHTHPHTSKSANNTTQKEKRGFETHGEPTAQDSDPVAIADDGVVVIHTIDDKDHSGEGDLANRFREGFHVTGCFWLAVVTIGYK